MSLPRQQDPKMSTQASSAEDAPKRPGDKRKIFGIGRRHARSANGSTTLDYEEKYAPDPIYEECSPIARIWRTYLEECHKYDWEVVEDWRDTLDVLLVFAGLFSAVVSAFAIEGYQTLQPDYQSITASLLIDLVSLQNDPSFEPTVPNLNTFAPTRLNIWVNGLWFSSLAASLLAALICGLVKQWLHHYMIVPSGTPGERSCIRQYRYDGLQLWHVPLIIGLLPVLMHLALALFFAGLALFLLPMYAPIAYFIIGLGGAAYIAYTVVTLLPLRSPQCPYQTPLGGLVHTLLLYTNQILRPPTGSSRRFGSQRVVTLRSLRDLELDAVRLLTPSLRVDAMHWLYSLSSNISVRSIVIQAIGGLPVTSVDLVRTKFSSSDILSAHDDLINGCLITSRFRDSLSPVEGQEAKLERLLRFELVIPKTVIHAPLVPILRLPASAPVELRAVGLTSHYRRVQADAIFGTYWSAESMDLLLGVLEQKNIINLPVMIWEALTERALNVTARVLDVEDIRSQWITMCAALLDAAARDWTSSPNQGPASSGGPEPIPFRHALHTHLPSIVVQSILGALTRMGFSPVPDAGLVTDRIHVLLSAVDFALHHLESPPSEQLLLHATQELERCVAFSPTLNIFETHSIHASLERIAVSPAFGAVKLIVLETLCVLLGIPARMHSGFLPNGVRVQGGSLGVRAMSGILKVLEPQERDGKEIESNDDLEKPLHSDPYFHALCRFLRHAFKLRLNIVYEAFGAIRVHPRWMRHEAFAPALEAYVLGLDAPPPNLDVMESCLALGRNLERRAGAPEALSKLCRMDLGVGDAEWSKCVEEMRAALDEKGIDSKERRGLENAMSMIETITGVAVLIPVHEIALVARSGVY